VTCGRLKDEAQELQRANEDEDQELQTTANEDEDEDEGPELQPLLCPCVPVEIKARRWLMWRRH
jgi:hypothetical protein